MQAQQIVALFCDLASQISDENCLKGLRITKSVNETKFEWFWVKLEARNCFQRQSFTKYETNSSFHVK